MSAMIRVLKWEEHQHYKDRDPVWIKLHRGLLDNYEWSRLQDASKSHLIGIWLLAARHNNQIPADPEWIGKRISATSPVDLQVLVDAGFIVVEQDTESDASDVLASCYVEERRGEKRREEKMQAADDGSNLPAVQVAISANTGLRANPLVRGFNELVPGQAVTHVTDWIAQGIPLPLICETVQSVASRFKPTPGNEQPSSFGYFDKPIRQAHARAAGKSLRVAPAPAPSRLRNLA